jgi:hypothetical protein
MCVKGKQRLSARRTLFFSARFFISDHLARSLLMTTGMTQRNYCAEDWKKGSDKKRVKLLDS